VHSHKKNSANCFLLRSLNSNFWTALSVGTFSLSGIFLKKEIISYNSNCRCIWTILGLEQFYCYNPMTVCACLWNVALFWRSRQVQRLEEFRVVNSTKAVKRVEKEEPPAPEIPEKLSEPSRAVRSLRKKFATREIPPDANPKQIHESNDLVKWHKLDNFRTRFNKLKAQYYGNGKGMLKFLFCCFFACLLIFGFFQRFWSHRTQGNVKLTDSDQKA